MDKFELCRQLRTFCEGPIWKALKQYIVDELELVRSDLESAPIDNIRDLQGKVAALRWCLELPMNIVEANEETTRENGDSIHE